MEPILINQIYTRILKTRDFYGVRYLAQYKKIWTFKDLFFLKFIHPWQVIHEYQYKNLSFSNSDCWGIYTSLEKAKIGMDEFLKCVYQDETYIHPSKYEVIEYPTSYK